MSDPPPILAERTLPRRRVVEVLVGSHVHEVETGTVLRELLPAHVDDQLVVAGIVNNRAKSLVSHLTADSTLEALTTAHWEGQRIFAESLGLLLVEAAHRLDSALVVQMGTSVGLGQRVEVAGEAGDLTALATALHAEMCAICEVDEPLREEWWMVDEAKQHFEAAGWPGAARLLVSHYDPAVRLVSYGSVYALRIGPFVPSAGMLRGFSLVPDEDGLLLVFGARAARRGRHSILPADDAVRAEARSASRQTEEMTRHHERWLSTLGIKSAGDFNAACVDGNVAQLIRVVEGFHEKRISHIADQVHDGGDRVKVIAVAGPSSSGKTTFIRRLIVQLQVNGMNPVGLGLDDYYVDRDDTPRDEEGEYDFESFDALRTDLLGEHLRALLRGEPVKTARFDFPSGKSVPDGGKELRLGADDVLLLEGIHGLNPRLLEAVPDDRIFRIFICPLTVLPIDRVSRLHASDIRLIRRIVRDRHQRGANAATNIMRWPSVRRGERQNIFPYQHHANAVFDSSLVYELSVLRVFAERYLLEVPNEHPAYVTASRLLQLVDQFIAIYPDHVPPTSLLREFIGGSGFEY